MYDLHARVAALEAEGVAARLAEAANTFPDVGIVAFNGIPFIEKEGVITYFGAPVTRDKLWSQILLGLGLGGALTYMNSGDHTLLEIADRSLEQGHDWAMHGISVTLCFAGCPTFVEMSFARDARFHLSWVEPRTATDWNLPRVFTATASLKTWRKYLANRDSPDFLKTQQRWLAKAYAEVRSLFPARY